MATAALIHSESKICAQAELDLFDVPPTLGQVEKTTSIGYRPSSTLSDNNIIEFFVSGTGDEYMDLKETKLHLDVSIKKADNTVVPLTADSITEVIPQNNFLHTMFSQLDVFLNDKLVSTSNNLYPYRAYLETLLNHGKDAIGSSLTCPLYYPETAGKLDEFSTENKSIQYRQRDAFRNRLFDMIGNLHSDMFHQKRYMLNNVDMKIRLMRSRNELCLMSNTVPADYKVIIHQATLFVHKVKLVPSLMLAHAQMLTKQPARYPFHRVEMKSFSIPSGTLAVNRDNLVLGQLPTHVIIGLVDADAANGNYRKNPFNFKHYYVNHLSLQVGSEQIPSSPLQPNFKEKLTIREYQQLLDALGYWRTDKGIEVDRDTYSEGFTLYGFNLTSSSQQCTEAFNLLRQGNLQLNIKFAEAIPVSVSVICHLTFQNMMEVDQSRNIVFDYAI